MVGNNRQTASRLGQHSFHTTADADPLGKYSPPLSSSSSSSGQFASLISLKCALAHWRAGEIFAQPTRWLIDRIKSRIIERGRAHSRWRAFPPRGGVFSFGDMLSVEWEKAFLISRQPRASVKLASSAGIAARLINCAGYIRRR